MALPDTLTIDGVTYVRADRGAELPMEESYTVSELARNTRFPESTLYDNIRRGELHAIMPNATTKGMRIMRSDWEAFVLSKRA